MARHVKTPFSRDVGVCRGGGGLEGRAGGMLGEQWPPARRWRMRGRVAMVRREVEERGRIAETLRTTRERLELSIERAAADAGVPLRYARLLEGETPSGVGVSDELYLIPFFRRYATALGLSAEDLLPDFLGQVQELPPPSTPHLHLRPRARRRLTALWRPLAVLAAIAGATVVILRHAPERPSVDDDRWTEAEHAERVEGVEVAAAEAPTPSAPLATGSAAEVAIANAPATPVATPTTVATATARATVATAAAPTIVATATVPEAGAHELKILATEETWLSLGIDDQPKHNIMLQPGETRSWSAARTFTLTIGNAGGITVTVDGRDLPSLGRPGRVVRELQLP